MGVAQKTMFSISDRGVKFFGISGAPMEHNAIAKSKETFFVKMDKRPRTINFAIFLWEGNCTEYPTSGLPNSKLDHIYIFYI